MKFYYCETCKSIFTFVKETEGNLNCCGHPLQELIPNTFPASPEKHIPIIERKDGKVLVKVSSTPHPMLPEHYIEWIMLETTSGYQLKNLHPKDAPMAEFVLSNQEEILAAYAYCNIHKLWKN